MNTEHANFTAPLYDTPALTRDDDLDLLGYDPLGRPVYEGIDEYGNPYLATGD